MVNPVFRGFRFESFGIIVPHFYTNSKSFDWKLLKRFFETDKELRLKGENTLHKEWGRSKVEDVWIDQNKSSTSMIKATRFLPQGSENDQFLSGAFLYNQWDKWILPLIYLYACFDFLGVLLYFGFLTHESSELIWFKLKAVQPYLCNRALTRKKGLHRCHPIHANKNHTI